MIDLTKPIRHVSNRSARVLATDLPNGFPVCIAWQTPAGNWNADTFAMDDLDEFENVPPPEKWMLVPVNLPRVFKSASEAHAFIKEHGHVSFVPVRILQEGETP